MRSRLISYLENYDLARSLPRACSGDIYATEITCVIWQISPGGKVIAVAEVAFTCGFSGTSLEK